jgi:plasmid maintenance system antidote protein VapI
VSIVDQLRKAMKDSGETEYAIAKAAQVPQSVLSRFVNGERGISLITAAKLCRYLTLELRRAGVAH